MPTYKTITVPTRGGGSRKQRVRVLASGKYKFVRNPGSKTRKQRKKASKPRTRSVKKTAKKKKNYRRKFTVPIAVAAPVALTFFSNVGESSINAEGVFGDIKQGRLDYAVRDLALLWTGFDASNGSWSIGRAKGLLATGIGFIVHKAASVLGVNRALGRARVPVIRV